MAVPILVPASQGTAQSNAHWMLEVDTASNPLAPTWLGVFGIQSFQPTKTDDMVEITDFDAPGWKGFQPFLSSWGVQATVKRKMYTGSYDPGQEFIRTQNEAKARLYVRYYDRYGKPEAYSGSGYSTWEPQGGDAGSDEMVQFTFQGDGARTAISNPVAVNTAPTITSGTPASRGAGQTVQLKGGNFIGATSVTVNAVALAATAYDIITNQLIEIVLPAGSAGTTPIVVINSTGSSNTLSYTRVV